MKDYETNGMHGSAGSATAEKKKSPIRANPVMNKVMKKVEAATDDNCATYGGIMVKTGYFLLMTVVGIVLYLMLNGFGIFGTDYIEGLKYEGFEFRITLIQVFYLVGVSIVTLITQLIAAFVPRTIPVTGTLYSVGQGFILSCLIFTILGYSHSEYLGLLALAITIVVVLTMAILYTTGIIRVTKKFKMVMMTLVFASIGISLIVLLCSFIPFVNIYVANILNNPVISIGLTLLSIILATLFLIAEFAQIDSFVQGRAAKKFEWYAAFGLAFTILWIYVKILDLVIQIAGNGRR